MTQYLIMCRSLTKAQSSARLLESAGITASVVKAPQELSGAGCGYALSLYRKFEEAVELLVRRLAEEQRGEPESLVLPVEVVRRASCGCGHEA